MIFNFGNEMHVRSVLWVLVEQVSSEGSQIVQISSEGDSHVVNFVFQAKLNNIMLVIVADSWKGDFQTRETHVLF